MLHWSITYTANTEVATKGLNPVKA